MNQNWKIRRESPLGTLYGILQRNRTSIRRRRRTILWISHMIVPQIGQIKTVALLTEAE
jgi:hypothetical protein